MSTDADPLAVHGRPESDDDAPDDTVDFVTLGMFIIDDIDFLPPRPPVRDILGGAGAYAALGARLFSPAPRLSRKVGWIVDRGSDFPPAMHRQIDAWQTAVVLRDDPGRLTTRGWNGYDVGEHRAFRYTTPKLRLTARDLPPALLAAEAVHIVSSAQRCRELVTDLLARRKSLSSLSSSSQPRARPFIVWEPVPDRCTPDELLECTNTLPLVDVCSPNHAELAAYMGDPDGGLDPHTGRLSRAAVERACEQLLGSMPLQSYTLVVRAAEHGCYIAKNGGRRRQTRAAAQQADKRRGTVRRVEGEETRETRPAETETKTETKPETHTAKRKQSSSSALPAPKMHASLPLLLAPPLLAGLPTDRSGTPLPQPKTRPSTAAGQPVAEAEAEADTQTAAAEKATRETRETEKAACAKPSLHGSLRPDIDMEALFAGLQQDEEGAIVREEIEVDPGLEMWVPAVWPGESSPASPASPAFSGSPASLDSPDCPDSQGPVVDPTGGGNAFLGAFAVALARGHGLEQAAIWGNVAASFAIQQVGVAVLGHADDGSETWNGERVESRCAAYEARLRKQGLSW